MVLMCFLWCVCSVCIMWMVRCVHARIMFSTVVGLMSHRNLLLASLCPILSGAARQRRPSGGRVLTAPAGFSAGT